MYPYGRVGIRLKTISHDIKVEDFRQFRRICLKHVLFRLNSTFYLKTISHIVKWKISVSFGEILLNVNPLRDRLSDSLILWDMKGR